MLTIAWDVDDVLNDLMRTWFEEWWKPNHPDCILNYTDLYENPPHQLLGVGLDEYLESLDAFRLSGHYERMLPNPEILGWFGNHGAAYRHISLTAVPRIAASVCAAWVIKHFGDWIRTFHFVPSPRPTDIFAEHESTKAHYLKWLNRVDIFIDDHTGNIQDVNAMEIRGIMLAQPWNSGGRSMNEILESLCSNS
jgi:hypothetical protein